MKQSTFGLRASVLFSLSLPLFGILCGSISAETLTAMPSMRIALPPESTDDAAASHEAFMQASLRVIEKQFEGKFHIEAVRLSPEALERAILREEIDAFIGSSARYRQFVARGLRDVASAVSERAVNPNCAIGSAVLVRADRFDLVDLTSLASQTVAARTNDDFFGLDAVLAEVAVIYQFEKKSLPEPFFKSIQTGDSASDLIAAVINGKADAAVLPSCVIEESGAELMKRGFDTGLLRVLAPKQDDSMHCLHSTSLYPGLTAATLPKLPPEASVALTKALFNMKPESGFSWSVATDFSRLDRSLEALGVNVWAPYRSWSPVALARRYWVWFASAAALLAFLLIHAVRVEYLVKVRTQALEEALSQVKQSNRRVEKLQKIAVLGQFATLLAHELRQPLNAIVCYAHGLRVFAAKLHSPGEERMQAPKAAADETAAFAGIETGIDAIEAQTARAAAIVSRVRAYVRRQARVHEEHDLRSVVENGLQTFGKTSLGKMTVSSRMGKKPLPILCDALELELVVINLLRNAAEAQQHSPNQAASIAAREDSGEVELLVTDDGPVLTEEALERIETAGDTTKPEGLGLGLSIVRTLVEANGGMLAFERGSPNGLKVRMRFPALRVVMGTDGGMNEREGKEQS